MNNDNTVLENNQNTSEEVFQEEVIGEHDIVIGDDFKFSMDVAEVEDDGNLLASNPVAAQSNEKLDLGTEQSGSITF